MSLLRSDREVVLNELLVASSVMADHYRYAMNMLENEELRRLFSDVADRHELMSNKLESVIRSLGDLPSSPDIDKETLEQWMQRFRAAISDDELGEIVQQRLHAESELLALAGRALTVELSEDEARLVRELTELVDSVKGELEAAMRRH